MGINRVVAVCAAWALLALVASAGPASAKLLDIRYKASDAYGDLAPPTYGLRLDGVFGGAAAVTFGFDSVFFDVFDDGSAQLHGVISVAEVGGAAPGAFASSWNMDVLFQRDLGFGGNPAFEYYHLIALGSELINQADANDVIDLSEAPVGGSKPFQLGIGVFPDSKCSSPAPCFGATGWLNWTHGALNSTRNETVADFLMELDVTVAPEPASFWLIGLGLAGLAFARRIERP